LWGGRIVARQQKKYILAHFTLIELFLKVGVVGEYDNGSYPRAHGDVRM